MTSEMTFGFGVRSLLGVAGRAVARGAMGPRGAAAAAAACALVSPSVALASPAGERVVYGDVTFIRQGNTLFIEASDGSIIEFDSFDIAVDEIVQFIQPHDRARVLNRILGAAPTQIDGQLYANGIVYLVNPAGVIFGPDSVINVGSIYAAAASISNDDFSAGIDRFTGAQGVVENHGAIQASRIHLLGRHVRNFGDIRADGGVITMAAGGSFLIQEVGNNILVRVDGKEIGETSHGTTAPDLEAEAGVVNEGTVRADGGSALLAAGDMYALGIYNAGEVRASGGRARLIANDGAVHNTGVVSASARGAGSGDAGEAIVRGPSVVNTGIIEADSDYGRAGYAELTSQNHTYLVGEGRVSAAGGEGHAEGGEVLVHSYSGTTYFGSDATISVAGGELGGDAGFVEVSGERVGFHGFVDLRARHGYENGTLLIDPIDIIISDDFADLGGGDQNDIDDGMVDFDEDFPTNSLETLLTINANALEQVSGDIVLEATRHIFVNTSLDLDSSDLTLDDFTLRAGHSIFFGVNPNTIDGSLPAETGGIGAITLEGFNNLILQADVSLGILPANQADGVGDIVFGSTVTINATQAITANAVGISVNGASLNAGTTITLDAGAFSGAGGDLTIAGGTLDATGALMLLADNNLSVSGNATLMGSALTLTADNDTSGVGALDLSAGAGNTITLTGAADLNGQSVTIGDGDVSASTTVDLDSASSVTVNGDLAAGGQLDVDAATVSFGAGGSLATTGGADLNVTSAGDLSITDGDLDAEGTLTLTAGNDLTVTGGSLTGDTAIVLMAVNNATLLGGPTITGPSLSLTADSDTDNAGIATLDLGGATLTLTGALAVTGESILLGSGTVDAGGNITLTSNAGITATGPLTLDSAMTLSINDAISASGGLSLIAVNDLVIGDAINAGTGDLTISSAGDLTVNAALTNAATLALTADSDASGAGTLTVSTAGTLAATDRVELRAFAFALTPTTVQSGSGGVLIGSTGDLDTGTLATIDTTGTIELEAANDLTVSSTLTLTNQVDLELRAGNDVNVFAAIVNADGLTITADTDADNSGDAVIDFGDDDLVAGGDNLTLGGPLVVDGENVEIRLDTLTAGAAATVNDAAVDIEAVSALVLDSAIAVSGAGGVVLSTGADLTLTDAITGVDFIDISADNLNIQGNLSADFDITLTGVTSVTTDAAVTLTTGDAIMISGPTLTLNADHMATGAITVNGTTVSIVGDLISSASDIDIDGSTSVTTMAGAAVSADGTLDINGGMLTLGAAHTAGGDLTLGSGGAVMVTGNVQSTGGALDVDGTAVSFANGTTLSGATGVDINGTTSVTLGTGTLDAGTGALAVTSAADLNVTRTLTTTGAITLTSDGNVAMSQAVTAGADSLTVRADADEDGTGDATLTFAGTYDVDNLVDIAGANVTIENTSLDSIGATFRAANDLTVGDSSSITLTLGGGDLLALAGDDATLGAMLSGLGALTLEADFTFAGGDPVQNTLGGDAVGVASLTNASAITGTGAVLVRGASVVIERTAITGTAVTLESTDATLLGAGDAMFGITFDAGNGVDQSVTATTGTLSLIGDTTYTSGTGTAALTLDGAMVVMNLAELTTTTSGGAAGLTVNGPTSLAGDVIVDADLSFDDTLTLTAAGDQLVEAGNMLSVSGNVSKATGSLMLRGDANANGGTLVDLNGNLVVTAGSLTIEGDSMLAGATISAGNQLVFTDAVALDGAGLQTLTGTNAVDAQAAITKATGNLRVTGGASAMIDLDAVTISAGNLTIDPGANAAVMLAGPVSVSGDFSSVGSTFANDDTISAATISIDHGGLVTIGASLIAGTLLDLSAGTATGDDLVISATNLNPITLRGDTINLSAGILDGVATAAEVTVTDGSFLTLTGGTNTAIGPTTLSWVQDADLLASNVFLGTFPTAPGTVSLTSAGGAVTLDAAGGITSATTLTLSAGTDVNIDAAVSAGSFMATANTAGGGGTIFVNQNVVTTGNIDLMSAADIAAALVDAGGDLTATGALDFTAAGAQTMRAGGTLTAMSTIDSTGDLALDAGTLVDVDGVITTTAGGDLTVDGAADFEDNLTIAGDLTFNDDANLAGQTIAAIGLATFSGATTFDRAGAGAQTVQAGDLLALDDVTGTTTGLVTMQITGGGEIELRGDTTTAGALTLDGDTVLSGTGDQMIDSAGAFIATGTLSKSTAGSLDVDGSTLAFMDDVEVLGAGDATFTGAADFDGDLSVTNGDLTVNNAVTFAGDVMAQNGVATFNASVVFDANSAFAGADPLARAGFQYLVADSVIAAAGMSRTDGGLRIDAASGATVTGNLTVDSIVAATIATLDMVGDLMVTGSTTAADDVLVTGDLDAMSVMAGNDINVSSLLSGGSATAGNDLLAGMLNLTGSATATAGDVSIGSGTVGGTVMAGNDVLVTTNLMAATTTAGNDINVGGTLSGGSATAAMDLIAGVLSLTGNATATAGDVSIGSGTVGGTVMAGNDVLVTTNLMAATTTAGNDISVGGTLSGGSATAGMDVTANAVTLTGDLTATGGSVSVTNALAADDVTAATNLSAGSLALTGSAETTAGMLSVSGNADVDGDMDAGTTLAVGGTTNLGGDATSGGAMSFDDLVFDGIGTQTLTSGATLDVTGTAVRSTAGDVVVDATGATTFAQAVTIGSGDLDLDSAGLTTFGGDVSVTGGGITAANAVTFAAGSDNVTTTGSQTYNGLVTFDDATVVTSSSGGLLTFNDMIAGDTTDAALTFNTSGILSFNADVAASSITSNAGTTSINEAMVSTRLGQTYANAVSFGGAVTLASSMGGDISFGSVAGSGGADLTLNTTGDTTFGGGAVTLGSLTTDAGGMTILSGNLTTNNAGGIAIADMLALGGADRVVTAGGGGDLRLTGGISGSGNALTLMSSGVTDLRGSAVLGSLATDAPGTVQLALDLTVDDGFDFGEGAVLLVGDTRLIDRDMDDSGTRIDETFGGNFSLLLASAGDLIIENDQGTGGGGALGSLALQSAWESGVDPVTGDGILFILADNLVANDTVSFNARGRADVPTAATVVYNLDPTLLASGMTREQIAALIDGAALQTLLIDADTFTMGQAEKMSVFGHLQIGAGTGAGMRASVATLSDVNTLGDMRVYADTIRLLARGNGFVLDSTGNLSTDADDGLDFVAGGSFDWFSMPVVVGGSAFDVSFGSEGRDDDVRGTLANFIQQDFGEPITALTLLGQPSVLGVPMGDVFALDLVSDGPTPTDTPFIFGGIAAVDALAEIPDDIALDEGEIDRLRQMAINAKEAELDSLDSVIALYDDVSTVWVRYGERRSITVNRLNNARVREVLAEFERVNGFVDGQDRRPTIAAELNGLLDAYIGTRPEGERFVDPSSEADIEGFTSYFVENATEETKVYLTELAGVLGQIRSLGLNNVEIREVRTELLRSITTGDQHPAFIGSAMQAVSGQQVDADPAGDPSPIGDELDELEARAPAASPEGRLSLGPARSGGGL